MSHDYADSSELEIFNAGITFLNANRRYINTQRIQLLGHVPYWFRFLVTTAAVDLSSP